MPNRWRKYFAADIPNSPVSPREALGILMEGNQRFVAGCPRATTPMERRAQFALGQSPIASVLCCADSRVAPEILFDQPLGEIFSVRVAGNFLHDDGPASRTLAGLGATEDRVRDTVRGATSADLEERVTRRARAARV